MSVAVATMARKGSRKRYRSHHFQKQAKPQASIPMPVLIKKSNKQVRFPDADDDLVKVVEFDDDIESQKMRECYWEIFARDRARFKDRIQQSEELLSAVLDPTHRLKVFQECCEKHNIGSLT